MDKLVYKILNLSKPLTLQDFGKIISLLKEIKGVGATMPDNEKDTAYVFYENVPFRPKLVFGGGEVIMETDLTDTISSDVLRPILNKLDFRIYLENIKSLIPRNLSIIECAPSTNEDHQKALKIMEKYSLTPVFNLYRKYVYYAVSNTDGSVHIVNDNLLYHFIHVAHEPVVVSEFSY